MCVGGSVERSDANNVVSALSNWFPRHEEMSDSKVGAMQNGWKGRDWERGLLLIKRELTRPACRVLVHSKRNGRQ